MSSATLELERAGIAVSLKDALSVLLEVRPADPIAFLAAYFRHPARPGDPHELARYLVRACPRSRPCFRDSLYSAFSVLARAGVSTGPSPAFEAVDAADVTRLMRLLCRGLPPAVGDQLLEDAELPSSSVCFPEFVLAVEACLAAEEASRAAAELFECCDHGGRGALPRYELLAELEALRQGSAGAGDGRQEMNPAQLHLEGIPAADVVRMHLIDAEGGGEVTASDLFLAIWSSWQQKQPIDMHTNSVQQQHQS